MKKIFFILIFLISSQNAIFADLPYYIDFKYILNTSDAGKKAQTLLKTKLDSGLKNLKDKEKKILEEEKQIIQQKKILSPENYKKK